jgi:hypothetical protein
VSIAVWPAERDRRLWLSTTAAVHRRRAVVQRVKGFAWIMFRGPAIAFPSTVIGFKLDNLRISDFGHRNTKQCVSLLRIPTPLRFLTGTFSLQDHPRWAARKAPMWSSYLRDGPVGTGQYRVRTARTRLGMGMPLNITKEDNQWHRIFRLPSQDEA